MVSTAWNNSGITWASTVSCWNGLRHNNSNGVLSSEDLDFFFQSINKPYALMIALQGSKSFSRTANYRLSGTKNLHIRKQLKTTGIKKFPVTSIDSLVQGVKALPYKMSQDVQGTKSMPLNVGREVYGIRSLISNESRSILGIKQLSLSEGCKVEGKKDITNILVALDLI